MDSSLRYADSSVHDISLGIRPHLHDEVVAVASHINQEIDAANSEFPLLDEDTEAFLKGLF